MPPLYLRKGVFFVQKVGSTTVFNLNCPPGPVDLRENYGFPSRELNHILDVLTANLKDLCRAWEHIHGIA